MFNEFCKREVPRLGSIRLLEEEFDLIGRDVRIAQVLQAKGELLSVNPPILISVQLVKKILKSVPCRNLNHSLHHLPLLHHHPRHHHHKIYVEWFLFTPRFSAGRWNLIQLIRCFVCWVATAESSCYVRALTHVMNKKVGLGESLSSAQQYCQHHYHTAILSQKDFRGEMCKHVLLYQIY